MMAILGVIRVIDGSLEAEWDWIAVSGTLSKTALE